MLCPVNLLYLVLKSTGSAFENFIRDEHTTLAEVNDRIFSTSVDLKYTYGSFAVAQNAVVDAFSLHTQCHLVRTGHPRFFLGVVESGVFPACFYLIAMWYKRAEAQKRYSFFFSSTTLAGGFGGLLASAIGKMDGMRGYSGWRWIFILGQSPLRLGRLSERAR